MEDLSVLLKAIYEQLVSCNEKLGGINEKLFEIRDVIMDFKEFGVKPKGLFGLDDIYEKLVSIEELIKV